MRLMVSVPPLSNIALIPAGWTYEFKGLPFPRKGGILPTASPGLGVSRNPRHPETQSPKSTKEIQK